MDSIATLYSNITQLDTIGYSVEGRVIQTIIITDNPSIEEDEPEVRIAGAHHGNELISVELPLYFIDYLVTRYGSNPTITSLVNDTEIWIIPMVNPDGVNNNIRYNANGYDLNRDYLCPEGDYCPYECNYINSFSEPETQAMKLTHEQNRFVMSLTMHSRNAGPPLICWCWGYSDALCPSGQYHATEDDDLMVNICETYESLNTTPGFYSINGNDWYAAHGAEDDYAYQFWGDIGCTLEISSVFAPPEEEIEQYWLDNREAIIYYISTAATGIRGIVRDANTLLPLDAQVDVLGPGIEVNTDTEIGDYHRPLLDGNYTIRFESPGYISQHINTMVSGGQATRIDVDLVPSEPIEVTLDIIEPGTGENVPSMVKMTGVSFDTSFYCETGISVLNVPADIYLMEVFSEGYISNKDPLTLIESGVAEIPMTQVTLVIFEDDFESGSGNWFFGGFPNHWGIYNPGYASPNCITDSPVGNYYANVNTYMESNFQPNFQGFDRACVFFQVKYDIEYHYDMAVLEYSANYGPWFDLNDTLTGSSNGLWELHYADLDYFCAEEVTSLRWGFRLASDGIIQHDGIYIDDILMAVLGTCNYSVGDINSSASYNGLDITYGVAFFKGGDVPLCPDCPLCPYWYYCGDVNGSCTYNGLDITYGVAYFKGGPEPIPCENCPPQ
jgi:hypothetical protein